MDSIRTQVESHLSTAQLTAVNGLREPAAADVRVKVYVEMNNQTFLYDGQDFQFVNATFSDLGKDTSTLPAAFRVFQL